MPMWEYELFVMQLNNIVKDENDQQKQEMDKYHVQEYMDMARPGNMQKMMQGPKMPAAPKMPSYNINVPKYK